MNTVREFFNLPVSTTAAILTCKSGVYSNQLSIGTFSLIGKILSKLSPRYISNTSIDRPKIALFHLIDTQIFNTDYSKTIDNLSRFLMTKVISPVKNSFVNTTNNSFSFLSFRRFLSLFRQLSLSFSKSFLVNLEKAGIINFLFCRKSGKGRNADIYTNRLLTFSQRLRLYFTRQACIPLIVLSPNGASFNIPNDRSMKFNFNRTYLRKVKGILFNLKTYLRICNAIIPPLPLEPRITNFLFTSLNSAEERFESKVNSGRNILENLGMDRRKRGLFFFQGRDRIALVKIANTFFLFLPRVFSLFKKMIIEPTAFFKRLTKNSYLFLCRKKPVFVCYLSHIYILHHFCLNVKDKIKPPVSPRINSGVLGDGGM